MTLCRGLRHLTEKMFYRPDVAANPGEGGKHGRRSHQGIAKTSRAEGRGIRDLALGVVPVSRNRISRKDAQ
jgi:hypothetical protein